MADYFALPVPFPCSVALFCCRCGAAAVDVDVKHMPDGWTTAADGAVRCPECSAEAAVRTATPA